MQAFIEHLPYLGVVIVLLLSGFGVPLPEDIPLLVGGWVCGLGHASLWIMIPVSFMSLLGADLIVFTLGRRYGHHISKLPLIRRYLTPKRMRRARAAFRGHRGKTIFTGRFMPGLRTPIFFTAGTFGVTYTEFIIFDGLAACLSAPLLVLVGYFVGQFVGLELVLALAGDVKSLLLVLPVLIVGVGVIWWIRRRRKLAGRAHRRNVLARKLAHGKVATDATDASPAA